MKQTRMIPRGMVPLANAEAAQCGEAMLAQNVREREQSLQVTGMPAAAGTIGAGERLLLITGPHRVTSIGGVVKVDGSAVLTVTEDIVGAHAIGSLVVVVTSGGLKYLSLNNGTWTVLDPADAMPQLTLTASCATSTDDIAAVTFAELYSQWQAPLADADTAVLAALLRNAWDTLTGAVAAMGRHCSPMLVRWAVRLWDDSLLWMSDAVRVGDETLSNADRISAQVISTGSGFTGTEATVMSMRHYTLDIGVARGIGADWIPLVKSIDVFATSEARLLASGRMLDYRCLTRTTGPREYVLEMGLARRSAAEITSELASSPWQLVATAPAIAMTGTDFVAPLEPMTLTNAQCSAVRGLTSLVDVTCSAAAAGRLYCCTADGDIVVSVPGNALVEANRRTVLGTVPLAMAVVTRALYSGGFGRYAVYLFTDDGIYAVPHGVKGALGEARLVDRTVIAAGVPPVEAGGDVWLVSRHGHLCCLTGSRLEVCQRDVAYRALAWCNAWQELWMLPADGFPVVRMASGRMSVRSVEAPQLYSDPRHAVAVTAAGQVLDLEREQHAVVPVSWHSRPVALDPLMGSALKRVVWHVSTPQAVLTLKVVGQRGIMAGDSDLSVMALSGAVDHPLAAPAVAARARTLRLTMDGTAQTGTLLLPVLIYTSTPKTDENHGRHII